MGSDNDIMSLLNNNNDTYNIDKEILTQIKEFFNADNIDLKTEIPKKDLRKFVLLKLYADEIGKYSKDSKIIIDNFINLFFKYILSSDRQSRKEFIDMIKSIKSGIQENSENEDMTKKLLSRSRFR